MMVVGSGSSHYFFMIYSCYLAHHRLITLIVNIIHIPDHTKKYHYDKMEGKL
jgi:hypothetical protein